MLYVRGDLGISTINGDLPENFYESSMEGGFDSHGRLNQRNKSKVGR